MSALGVKGTQRFRWSHKIENDNAGKLYRLDDAARRMRVRVLTVIFAAAFGIVIAMIAFDFLGH
jgi:hypothetical protein